MNFSEITNITIPNGVVNKITTLEGVVLWIKKGVKPDYPITPNLPIPNNNEIYYISTDRNKIEFSNYYSGITPITHTYENGIGKMVFRNELTSIGDYMFFSVDNLHSIILPKTIQYINQLSFNDCDNLETIYITDNIEFFGVSAFSTCKSLKDIYIPKNVVSLPNNFCMACESLTKVVIPDNIQTLGQSIFDGCYSLVDVTISNNMWYISSRCFKDCRKLPSIVLHKRINSIRDKAFKNCYLLRSITCLRQIAPTIEADSFENTGIDYSGLKVLRVPEGAEGYETWLSQLKGFKIEYITE